MKPKTFEKLIQEASDDDRLRWKRAGVGGGIAGALISGAFRFRNDAEQLAWMGIAIVGGIVIGLATEWIHPWASDEPARFLQLVEAIWPAANHSRSNEDGAICYRVDLLDSIHGETDQLRAFFAALEKLHWTLVSEEETTRSYRRRNQLLRVSLDTADQSCQLVLAVAKVNPMTSSLR